MDSGFYRDIRRGMNSCGLIMENCLTLINPKIKSRILEVCQPEIQRQHMEANQSVNSGNNMCMRCRLYERALNAYLAISCVKRCLIVILVAFDAHANISS
jgi:hypothetical protein